MGGEKETTSSTVSDNRSEPKHAGRLPSRLVLYAAMAETHSVLSAEDEERKEEESYCHHCCCTPCAETPAAAPG